MKKELENQKESNEVISQVKKNREVRKFLIIGIIIFLISILMIISVVFYKYFNSPEKELGISGDIESFMLSEDGKVSYLGLKAGSLDKNISKVKFIFRGDDEYVYETSEGAEEISVPYKENFWNWLFKREKYNASYDYSVSSDEIGLEDFDDINNVSVVFVYEDEGVEKETDDLDTQKKGEDDDVVVGSPGSSSPSSGPSNDDGGSYCGDGNCDDDENCENCEEDCGECPAECGNDIIESGETCDGTGLEKTCGDFGFLGGEISCLNDCSGYNTSSCIEECKIENDCYYVSVIGAGSHNGSLGNEMNLSEAMDYANSNTDTELMFLLEGGEYGYFVWNNIDREKSVTLKPVSGEEVVFYEGVYLGSNNGDYDDLKIIFDGITFKQGFHYNKYFGILMWYVNDVKIKNSIFISPGYSSKNNDIYNKAVWLWEGKARNIEINNCTFKGESEGYEEGWSYAVYAENITNLTISNSEIRYCNFGFNGYGDNLIIKNNYIHDMDSDGMRISGGAKDILIENNNINNVVAPWIFNWTGLAYYSEEENTLYVAESEGDPFPVFNDILASILIQWTNNSGKQSYKLDGDLEEYNFTESFGNKIVLDSEKSIGYDIGSASNPIEFKVDAERWYHEDMIQFYTAGSGLPFENVVIRNNTLYNSGRQGIFMNSGLNPSFINVTIVENLIYDIDHSRKIWIYDTNGLNISYNTVIGGRIFLDDGGGSKPLYDWNINYNVIESITNEGEDYNVISFWGPNNVNPDTHKGEHSVVVSDCLLDCFFGDPNFTSIFADYNNYDFHPIINGPACDGSVNGKPGVAVGALPCVCTEDSQCVEVYGSGSSCDGNLDEPGSCVEGSEKSYTYSLDEDNPINITLNSSVTGNWTRINNPNDGRVNNKTSLNNVDLVNITYTPDNDYFGEDYFEYNVSDGINSEIIEVNTTVNPTQDPPEITINDWSVLSGTTMTFTLPETDIDNDIINYSITNENLPGVNEPVINENVFTWQAEGGLSDGTYSLTIRANDSKGGIDNENFNVIVNDIAGTYYLNSSIASSGDGESWENAFKTLEDAFEIIKAGDTLLVDDGNYGEWWDKVGRTDWLTIKAANGANPVFDYFQIGHGSWDKYNYMIELKDLTINYNGDNANANCGIRIMMASDIKLTNLNIIGDNFPGQGDKTWSDNWLKQTYGYGVQIAGGSENIIIDNCTISDWREGVYSRDNEGSSGRYDKRVNSIAIKNSNFSRCRTGIRAWGHNFTIQNNVFNELFSDGILILADGIIIENNIIHDVEVYKYLIDESGATYSHTSKIITANSGTPYSDIEGNKQYVWITVDGERSTGEKTGSYSGNTITLNRSFGEEWEGDITKVEVGYGWHTDGIQIMGSGGADHVDTHNVTMIENKIDDIQAQGFYCNVDDATPVNKLLIKNNFIYDCGSNGLQVFDANLTLINNTIDNGAVCRSGTNATVSNNIFYSFTDYSTHNIWPENVNINYYDSNIVNKYYFDEVSGDNIEYNNETNFKNLFVDYPNDFHPLINSDACNGSINPVGTAVGALPCICTEDSQCVEVYDSGSNCNIETGKCIEQVSSFSPLTRFWRWLKNIFV